MEILEDIVQTDQNISVDVELEGQKPPETLYHGTAARFVDRIMQQGLKPMSRLYVHLSANGVWLVKFVDKRYII